jgi:hypothetical protein
LPPEQSGDKAADAVFREMWYSAYEETRRKRWRKQTPENKYSRPSIQEVVRTMTETVQLECAEKIEALRKEVEEIQKASSLFPWAVVLSLLRFKLVEFLMHSDPKVAVSVTKDLLKAFTEMAREDPEVLKKFLAGTVGETMDDKENSMVIEDLLNRVKRQTEILEVKPDARPA